LCCGGQRFLFRSKYDSSYATFTPTLAYLWYLVPNTIYSWREINFRASDERESNGDSIPNAQMTQKTKKNLKICVGTE
jgi:hypothetical protein